MRLDSAGRRINGTTIVDVTDPKNPTTLAHIPGDEGAGEPGGAQMVRLCDGKTLPKGDPNAVYLLRTFGNQAHEIWNVADPSKPQKLSVISSNLVNTHKNWWECDTGIAYLVSGPKEWRTRRMTEIFDLSDPSKPVKSATSAWSVSSRARPARSRPSCMG